jgi:hypothetical protein
MITKIVESNHYHLWTDALHARELAKQTDNRWDRGTYVRWAIITAWTALEIAFQDALSSPSISYSFRKYVDQTVAEKNLPKINWGKGIWQRALKVQKLRKNITHRFLDENDLFPDAQPAVWVIETIRESIKQIYVHCSKTAPSWVNDDYDEGWTTGRMSIHATGNSSPYRNLPDAIKLSYVYKGLEYDYDFFAPNTDVSQPLENIFPGVGKAITAVRLYRGKDLLMEYKFEPTKIRGA